MANDKTNESPVNPSTAAANPDAGELYAQGFKNPNQGGVDRGNRVGGSVELINFGFKLWDTTRQLDHYVKEASQTAREVDQALGKLDHKQNPHAGVRVTISQGPDGLVHMATTPANSLQEALNQGFVHPKGTTSKEVWVPDNPNLSPNVPKGVEVMSPQQFQRAFGFKNMRAELGEEGPSLASNTNTNQILAGLNITDADKKQFKQEGQVQADAAVLAAKPAEPKVSQETPSQEAPSRRVM
jgi:hypothetical protein